MKVLLWSFSALKTETVTSAYSRSAGRIDYRGAGKTVISGIG